MEKRGKKEREEKKGKGKERKERKRNNKERKFETLYSEGRAELS